MKKLSVLFGSALLLMACNKQSHITAEVANIPEGTNVELQTIALGAIEPTTVSKAVVKDSKVVFENTFADIDEAFLVFSDSESSLGAVPFIAEKGDISIFYDKDEMTNIKIGGTEGNDKLQELQAAMTPKIQELQNFLSEQGLALMMPAEEGDQEAQKKRAEVEKQYELMLDDVQSFPAKFKAANKNSSVSLLILSKEVQAKVKSAKEFQEEFDQFPIALKSSTLGKKTQAGIKSLSEVKSDIPAVGKKLGDFKALNPNGDEITLYEYIQGKKLLLVDVWAAWCGPCRRENPNFVKVYNLYNDKGFEIIGYSLDKNEEEWLKAIEKDKLTWTQVSNLKYWEDPIVSAYSIQGIPANYLIDENGIVLAMNLRGEALEVEVKKALGL